MKLANLWFWLALFQISLGVFAVEGDVPLSLSLGLISLGLAAVLAPAGKDADSTLFWVGVLQVSFGVLFIEGAVPLSLSLGLISLGLAAVLAPKEISPTRSYR